MERLIFEVAYKSSTSASPVYTEFEGTIEEIKQMVESGEIYSTWNVKEKELESRYNIFANSINGFRLFNLGLDGDEGFCKAEVERLNAENKDEQIVYGYEEV